ncbi:MAG TPA: phosphoribosylformylglycinamidine synthase [Dissulfurispiraceae bacterium]|nr:phosphoribosylformylglycinamidine synthase [Dissulfurispiraceae bacterium]
MPREQLLHLYRTPALSDYKKNVLLGRVRSVVGPQIADIETEFCFNIETVSPLDDAERERLRWLLAETFEPDRFSDKSFLEMPQEAGTGSKLIEVGPRMNFSTAWSTNAVSICYACGLHKISRIERSRRYLLVGASTVSFDGSLLKSFLDLVHDRMTECVYREPLNSFDTGIVPKPPQVVPLMEKGKAALAEINRAMGLGLDEWDIDYYYNLFVNDIGRNPTDVECFDLSQSNSEHSRHWFFGGRLVIDGVEADRTLMQIVKEPYKRNPNNSIIAFKDNSSAIRGFAVKMLAPLMPGLPSAMIEKDGTDHIIFTAETHNFPSGVAPFPGAETGTGGRIRDVHATGRGSHVVAGTAAYCVGNLNIPGYDLPWEDKGYQYPSNLASPLQIEIDASNGASDYGNKFGEPLIQGFTRSFGLTLPDGERREWIKPIMFTGGVGRIDSLHVEKQAPAPGMVVVKIGGPAYRIGMGGGAASSMIQGENVEELDFNAVQRGDAEMEQKLNRVIRACVELGSDNPITSIHDQGAGGNCNVVKEIIYPAGARIDLRAIQLGDATLSVLEIWGAEYQEQDALLIYREGEPLFRNFCEREKVPFAVIGEIVGDGRIVLFDSRAEGGIENPVCLDLAKVLGEMPRKTFQLDRRTLLHEPLQLPPGLTVREALERVLRLVSVGSKRFLTNKVDRSVTGLIARQQCAGPLQLTVADVAVVAQGHLELAGAAIAIGEQPVKGLIDPAAMARLSVGEALTNIVWAGITAIEDIRCSGNWMWAPKLPGEGVMLYDAAAAMGEMMIELGIAVDGGKDSLSMAARVTGRSGEQEVVKSPGTLVISAYAGCPDITSVVTPDIKKPGASKIFYIDLGAGFYRTGGSALAQCFAQVGNVSPDVEDPALLKRAFGAIQELISRGLLLAGHDRSDGGLVTTLLEMAFAGNCGLDVTLPQRHGVDAMSILFAEELGLVAEYSAENEQEIFRTFKEFNVPIAVIGVTTTEKRIVIKNGAETVLDEDMRVLRAIWEETSHRLDLLQANPDCVLQERDAIYDRPGPAYKVSFDAAHTSEIIMTRDAKPLVAIVREEGSNSDREMAAAFYSAGFVPYDVTMTDLMAGAITLDRFKGIAMVGGFSYADVMDSAKGWAGTIRFNRALSEQFEAFYHRQDSFSIGICNGCQLMALLGWVPWRGIADELQPRFVHNLSGRFESRFSTVRIDMSPAIMLKGMEGSVLGVWVSHGEGRAYFPDSGIMKDVLSKGLAPVRFVDDLGIATETYPFNPNGSPQGIAALCSPDGRHLAIMPHPERTCRKWNWAWMPEEMKKALPVSPWLKPFQNAREWCDGQE